MDNDKQIQDIIKNCFIICNSIIDNEISYLYESNDEFKTAKIKQSQNIRKQLNENLLKFIGKA